MTPNVLPSQSGWTEVSSTESWETKEIQTERTKSSVWKDLSLGVSKQRHKGSIGFYGSASQDKNLG